MLMFILSSLYCHFIYSYTALLWQKEARQSDISSKRAKCVRHFRRHQWYIMMSDLTYLLAG